jgi:ATP-dependent Lhr-like helicase
MLKIEEEKALPLVEKRGEKLGKNEEKMQVNARQTAELIERYGKAAAVALSARRVSAADVRAVLEKEPKLSDKFYELILEAERKVLSKRFR